MMRRVLLITIFAILLIGIAFGAYFLNKRAQTNSSAITTMSSLPFDNAAIVIPRPDGYNGRAQLIDDGVGGTISVKDSNGVRYTVEIPPNALSQSAEVQVAPFLDDGNKDTLDTGVLINAGKAKFTEVVTLSIDLSSSSLKNDAPKIVQGTNRYTGSSAVYLLEQMNKQLTPQLVSRPLETETYIPARITSSGLYLFSLNSARNEALARLTLANPESPMLPIIETATILLSSDKSLSLEEQSRAALAVNRVIATKNVQPSEVYAALALEKILPNRKTSVDDKPYAIGYCSRPNINWKQAVVSASIGNLLNAPDIQSACMKAATAGLETGLRTALTNTATNSAQLILAKQDMTLLDVGQDKKTEVQTKLQETILKQTQAVLANDDASLPDLISIYQHMVSLGGADSGSYSRLVSALKKAFTQAMESPIPPLTVPESLENDVQPLVDFTAVISGTVMADVVYNTSVITAESALELAKGKQNDMEKYPFVADSFCALNEAYGNPTLEGCASSELETKLAVENIMSVTQSISTEDDYNDPIPVDIQPVATDSAAVEQQASSSAIYPAQ